MRPRWDRLEAARERFRERFGQAVLFHVPVDSQYPAGTAVNSAGKPLDPTVEAGSGGGWTDASGVFNVVVGPVKPDDGSERSAVGYLPDGEIAVVVPEALFTDSVNDATEITHAGSRFRVTARDRVEYGPTFVRIVYGERK